MALSRRRLIAATAASLAFAGLARRADAEGLDIEADVYASDCPAYGPLKRDPAGLFDLPEGFAYAVVSRAGEVMSDGLLIPGKFDGMGCFPLDDRRVILVRNHECKHLDTAIGPYGPDLGRLGQVDRARIYDFNDAGQPLVGGTTTVVYDLKARRAERQHLSLAGTSTNCAGGTTPWGSWLSCEETTQTAGLEVGKDHGFVFEVPAAPQGLVEPAPLRALGRFRHEAACVDPRTGIVYMTEDEPDGQGLVYRLLPDQPGALHRGGRLQCLGFRDAPTGGDTRNWEAADWKAGDRRPVAWIDLDGVDNPYSDLRWRGHARGGAWVARGEGIFFGQGAIYISSTSGGAAKFGQILRYRPSAHEGQAGEAAAPGDLELFIESADRTRMEMNDNIAVAPWGHLIVCEDKEDGVNYLRGVTPRGRLYTLGRNAVVGGGDVGLNAELAGACFSPDGTTLFVNVYRPGMTLAITGPWRQFRA